MKRVLIALLVLGSVLFVLTAAGLGLLAWLAPADWQDSVVISIDGHRLALPDWHWGHGLAGVLGGSLALLLALLVALVLVPLAVLLGLLAALLGVALGLLGVVIALAVGLSPLLLLGLVVWLVVRDRRPPPAPPAPPVPPVPPSSSA